MTVHENDDDIITGGDVGSVSENVTPWHRDYARTIGEFIGQRITDVRSNFGRAGDNSRLSLVFTDRRLELSDDGQSCCERRYMTCDDDLTGLVGAVLQAVEIRDMGNAGSGCDEHEQMCLRIVTDQMIATVVTHNEHNGYYGGFALVARSRRA